MASQLTRKSSDHGSDICIDIMISITINMPGVISLNYIYISMVVSKQIIRRRRGHDRSRALELGRVNINTT